MNLKKIMISGLAVLFAMTFSGVDYANAAACTDSYQLVDSGGCTTAGSAPSPTHTFKGSKNVYAQYKAGGGLDYTIATYHFSGNKTYGSSSYDQKIFTWASKAKAPEDAPGNGTEDPGFGASWTSL